MLEELLDEVMEELAELNLDMCRTHDVYRLLYLLKKHVTVINIITSDVKLLVEELEGLDNGND